MEALAVFGIACNVIQVISFTHETISICKAVYNSGAPFDSAYTSKIVGDYEKICDDLQRKIQYAGSGACAEEKELFNIASDCLLAAKKLKSSVNKLATPSSRGKALGSIYAGVAAKFKGGRLQKLEDNINKHKARLESHLLMKVCKTTDATALQQSAKFAALDTTLQKFIQIVADGYQHLENNLISHETSINTHTSAELALQTRSIKNHITEELSQAQKAIAVQIAEKSQIIRQSSNTTTDASHARLIRSLMSADLQGRKAEIKVAHNGTFEWIFDAAKWLLPPAKEALKSTQPEALCSDHTCGPHSTAKFDCFTCWLAHAPGTLYWISGKAGSGKSTFAKFLVGHSKTKQLLENKHGQTLILSHFIWLSGSPIQRSLRGILLSLIYQFLHQDQIQRTTEEDKVGPEEMLWTQNAVKFIMEAIPNASHKETASDWTYDELQAVLMALLKNCPVAVCIFLDGLDEADNDMHSVDTRPVLALADWLCRIPRVKLCVTSRPESAFRAYFRGHPCLELQHLTRDDIRAFVIDKLRSQPASDSEDGGDDDVVMEKLANKICYYSDGVFLWVCLVTRSLLRGQRNGDTLGQMHDRLELLPRNLNQLYQSMWRRLDEEDQELYQREAAMYINLALEKSQLSLLGANMSLVQLYVATHPETAQGTLTDQDSHPSEKLQKQYSIFGNRVEAVTAGLLEATDAKIDRTMPVSFVHRSAKEFFTGTVEGKAFLSADAMKKSQRRERLFRGGLVAVWYAWYRNSLQSKTYAYAHYILREVPRFVETLSLAVKLGYLDEEQRLNLVYLCQQAYFSTLHLSGRHTEEIVWDFDERTPGQLVDNRDFSISYCRVNDKNLLVSCLGADLGSRENVAQIMASGFSNQRLPMVISQSYKAYILQCLLRTDVPKTHESTLWMLDQGVFDNWPQGKEAAGLIQGLAGAAVSGILRRLSDEIEWRDLEILRRCLALDGAWDEKLVFALEEGVPRSAGCTVSLDLVCGNLSVSAEAKTSYMIQAQATMPFLVSAILQTIARPKADEKTLSVIHMLENEVRHQCPDGPSPAEMFSMHWDDYRHGGGKLGEYGFVNISKESWSTLSLSQFCQLLTPGPPGPLQEAIQSLDITTCERWDVEGIRQEMLTRIMA